MKVVVTGASGFIGQAFVKMMLAQEKASTLVLMTSSKAGEARLNTQWPGLQVERLTTSNGEVRLGPLRDADILLHLGWSRVPATAKADPQADLTENVEFGLRLMRAAGDAKVHRFVFLSSGGTVYGSSNGLPLTEGRPTRPVSAYGVSKLIFEEYLRACAGTYGFEYVILRPANVYGNIKGIRRPQGVIEHWLADIANDRPVEIWNGLTTIRDYIHIADLLTVLLRSLTAPVGGKTINVGTGIGTSLAQLLALMEEVTGRKVRLGPVRAENIGATDVNILSTVYCEEVLGVRPAVTLREGIAGLWTTLRGDGC